jgi:uncharacterized membrane protein
MVQDEAIVCPHCRFSLKMNYVAVLGAVFLLIFFLVAFGD